jgi:hypothetical protein
MAEGIKAFTDMPTVPQPTFMMGHIKSAKTTFVNSVMAVPSGYAV